MSDDVSEGMREGAQFLELLELQGSNDMVTKSQLLQRVRRGGVSISDRQLTTYITEQLVPKSARIGSRAGAFPEIVVDLVSFISVARKRALSFAAIRELVPVWRFMKQAVLRDKVIDLAELEYVARQHVTSPEATFSIPWLVQGAIPYLCDTCNEELKIRYRNGDLRSLGDGDPPVISFVMAELEDDGEQAHAVSQVVVPLPRVVGGEDRTRVVIGVPPNVDLVEAPRPERCADERENSHIEN